MRNCAVVNNAAVSSNAITLTHDILGGGLYQSYATNCTITGNSALRGGGAFNSTLRNCILYHNYAAKYADLDNHHACTMDYCCTTPQPATGMGNIISDPQLLDPFHVHGNSPCLSNGNAAWLTGTDIDGETWKSPPAIGCDEYYSGAATGLLSAAISLDYTNVGRTYPVCFVARVTGRPSAVC